MPHWLVDLIVDTIIVLIPSAALIVFLSVSDPITVADWRVRPIIQERPQTQRCLMQNFVENLFDFILAALVSLMVSAGLILLVVDLAP